MFSTPADRGKHSSVQSARSKIGIIEHRSNQSWTKCVQKATMKPIVGKRSSPVKLSKQIAEKTPKKCFPNAKIFSDLKQVDLRSMLLGNKPVMKEDDIQLKSSKKVHEIIKNFENNFVDTSPVLMKPKNDETERSSENESRLKNAFEVIMRQGGDTQIKKTPRGCSNGSDKKRLKRLDQENVTSSSKKLVKGRRK